MRTCQCHHLASSERAGYGQHGQHMATRAGARLNAYLKPQTNSWIYYSSLFYSFGCLNQLLVRAHFLQKYERDQPRIIMLWRHFQRPRNLYFFLASPLLSFLIFPSFSRPCTYHACSAPIYPWLPLLPPSWRSFEIFHFGLVTFLCVCWEVLKWSSDLDSGTSHLN